MPIAPYNAKNDVDIRACDERLCLSCSEYNDACVREDVHADWESVSAGYMPVKPGSITRNTRNTNQAQSVDTIVNVTIHDSQETHAKSVNDIGESETRSLYETVVINPTLCYMAASLDNSPADHICKCCHDFYTLEELNTAKNVLWEVGDKSIMPAFKKRRDSSNRSEASAVLSDMITVLQKLDAAQKMPKFAVDISGLNRIPKAIPSETNSISMCERLARLENRMAAAEECISTNVCKVIEIEDKVKSQKSYASALTATEMPPPSSIPPVRHHKRNVDKEKHEGKVGQREVPKESNDIRRVDSLTSLTSNVSRPSATTDGFEYPSTYMKKNRRKKHITGTSRTGKLQGAPEPSRDIFVYRVSKEATETVIGEHMLEQNVEVRRVEKVSNVNAKYGSFKVELKLSDLEKVLDANFWPEGVCVRRFFQPRKSENHNHG